MRGEWVTGIHEGYRTKIVQVGNATVEINRPLLMPDEQRKREEQVIAAMSGLRKDRT